MKKLLFIFSVLIVLNQAVTAQEPVRTYLALQGEYKLETVPFVSANEHIGIHLMIDNTAISEYKHVPLPPGTPAAQPLLAEQLDEFPWRIENWRVVEGGGTMSPGRDGTREWYNAPAQAPPNDLITVSVDLTPKHAGLPKMVLLATIYFTHNDNAVYFHLPQIGVSFGKYVANKTAGVKAPTMQGVDPRAMARMPPEVLEKMKEAQKAMAEAQKESGVDLSAVTSNAVAFYDADSNVTAVKLTSLKLLYNNRRANSSATGNAMLQFTFKGKDVGEYKLDEPGTGVGFVLSISPPIIGAGCGQNNGSEDGVCDGWVKIFAVDDKTIKGRLFAHVYTVPPNGKTLYMGYIASDFVANRAK